MQIRNSLSNYSGLGQLQGFAKSTSKEPQFGDNVGRQSGIGPQPSNIPLSIADTVWALQAGTETYINPPSGKDLDIKEANKKAAEEFTQWSKMSPEQFVRASYLGAHNLTEDDLKAMSPEERAAIEKEIAEQIKRQLTDVDATGDGTTKPTAPEGSNAQSSG